MKIYRLNIDAAQPTNQVVQMQQNATGVLSVNVTKNGEYIRNLSCQVFDGETEIPAGDKGFKLDIGDTPKHYTVKASATPIECVAQYVANAGSGSALRTLALSAVQLEAGTYMQDEFASVINKFASPQGMKVTLVVHRDDLSNANFDRMTITHWPERNESHAYFYPTGNAEPFPPDAPLIVTGPVSILRDVTMKRNATLSSYTYPAIGYYVNYQADTLIKPSTNTAAFSEAEILPDDAGFAQLSADGFTLNGVAYSPVTLSVDGVAYTVLAAPVETPEEPAEPAEE